MKKFIFGIVLGAIAGYYYREIKERGDFDQLTDDVNDIANRAKRDLKNVVDKGKNQVESLKYQAENKIEEGLDKLNETAG